MSDDEATLMRRRREKQGGLKLPVYPDNLIVQFGVGTEPQRDIQEAIRGANITGRRW
jgi:hypothetical protein